MTKRGAYWDLTERQALCLGYLDDKMEASAFQIGRFIRANCLDPKKGGSNLPAIGAAVAGKLRKLGFVTFLPDLQAWRITRAGRDVLRDDDRGVGGEQAPKEEGK